MSSQRTPRATAATRRALTDPLLVTRIERGAGEVVPAPTLLASLSMGTVVAGITLPPPRSLFPPLQLALWGDTGLPSTSSASTGPTKPSRFVGVCPRDEVGERLSSRSRVAAEDGFLIVAPQRVGRTRRLSSERLDYSERVAKTWGSVKDRMSEWAMTRSSKGNSWRKTTK